MSVVDHLDRALTALDASLAIHDDPDVRMAIREIELALAALQGLQQDEAVEAAVRAVRAAGEVR